MKVTWLDRLRYRFDLLMSRGTGALMAWLFGVTALLVVGAAVIVYAMGIVPAPEGGEPPGFWGTVWLTLMHAMDAGTVAGDGGERPFLAVMFGVTLGGIFVVSILVGLITSGIQARVEALRKGRSVVCEEDHTVILGWSPQIFSIVSELVIANRSRPRAAIAILADRDKVEMEDALSAHVGSFGNTRVVCRTGKPIEPTDLLLVRPETARSIIVLAPEEAYPDAEVLKTTLALVNGPNRKAGKYHIVAEIRDRENMEAARLVGEGEVELVCTEDILSRITVQTCQQSGLSVVITELLDFDGDEIYIKREPSLVGKTFGDALFAYESCAVLGLVRDGAVRLLPPMDSHIDAKDSLIAVAEDDATFRLEQAPRPDEALIATSAPATKSPEKTLILGFNRRVPRILLDLDGYVPEGSVVTVVADAAAVADELREVQDMLQRITVDFRQGSTTSRAVLDKLALEYDHVLTVSDSDRLDPQQADARTLVTLLHLRDIEAKKGERFSIVSEMLDLRNRQLAEAARADDFIVSDRLVSLLLAQISENKHLGAVFDDLFDPDGAELYLKPISDYVALGKPVSFSTVVEAARRRGEIAIGFRRLAFAGDADKAYGIVVNPKKSEKVTFKAEDRVIVLAES